MTSPLDPVILKEVQWLKGQLSRAESHLKKHIDQVAKELVHPGIKLLARLTDTPVNSAGLARFSKTPEGLQAWGFLTHNRHGLERVLTRADSRSAVLNLTAVTSILVTSDTFIGVLKDHPEVLAAVLANAHARQRLAQRPQAITLLASDSEALARLLEHPQSARAAAQNPAIIEHLIADPNVLNSVLSDAGTRQALIGQQGAIATLARAGLGPLLALLAHPDSSLAVASDAELIADLASDSAALLNLLQKPDTCVAVAADAELIKRLSQDDTALLALLDKQATRIALANNPDALTARADDINALSALLRYPETRDALVNHTPAVVHGVGKEATLSLFLANDQARVRATAREDTLQPMLAAYFRSHQLGAAGTLGFGVGAALKLPEQMAPLTGYDNRESPNYGNYERTQGGIYVYIPAFYYRVGHPQSPHFHRYGVQSLDIVPLNFFSDRQQAMAHRFVLHRAFIDGGQVQSGFFIHKYLASARQGRPHSAAMTVPLSLTYFHQYSRTSTLDHCTGQLRDALILAKTLGSECTLASVFMYSALSMLTLAHAQAANHEHYCAWWQPAGQSNYPRGCHNGQLGDDQDSNLSWQSAGDVGDRNKPRTGSCNDPAKTSHNGQLSGVMDLSGGLWEVMLGVTTEGAHEADSRVFNYPLHLWILKESTTLANLTVQWGQGQGAWGTAEHLARHYHRFRVSKPELGNNTERLFSGANQGAGYYRDSLLLSAAVSSLDQGQLVFQSNSFPVMGGDWASLENRADLSSINTRHWCYYQAQYGGGNVGFRCALYG